MNIDNRPGRPVLRPLFAPQITFLFKAWVAIDAYVSCLILIWTCSARVTSSTTPLYMVLTAAQEAAAAMISATLITALVSPIGTKIIN